MFDALNGWLDDYFFATLVVLQVFIVSLILAVFFGLMGASAKLSKNGLIRTIGQCYTVFFRGTPEFIVLLILYFGASELLKPLVQVYDPSVEFIEVSSFWTACIAIGLVVGAYMTETFRGAFLGVDRGQVEAARALGLSSFATFIHVRIPQMWRLALPNMGNHMLSIMKDTALISVIGVEEIFYVAELAIPTTHQPFTMYAFVACIYLTMTAVISHGTAQLEKRANRHIRRPA